MAGPDRYLLGPQLLIGLCGKEARAVQWSATVQECDCVLSRLAIAIVRSVINTGSTSEVQRQDWHQALNATVSRMEAGALRLTLEHPTRGAEDLQLELPAQGPGWRIEQAVDADHDWIVHLRPADGAWRLQGRLPRQQHAARLAPVLGGGSG